MQNVKQELRRLIKETLLITYQKPVVERRRTVRQQLVKIQTYCKDQEKTFIFRELTIRCDQYEVGGKSQDIATLFRGPSEKASVAICVTQKGSLLHRNDGCWQVWDNAGDVAPQTAAPQVSAPQVSAPQAADETRSLIESDRQQDTDHQATNHQATDHQAVVNQAVTDRHMNLPSDRTASNTADREDLSTVFSLAGFQHQPVAA